MIVEPITWISVLKSIYLDKRQSSVEINQQEQVVEIRYSDGIQHIFLGLVDGKAYLSESLADIVAITRSTINAQAVINQLADPQESSGYQTIFDRVYVLPPKTIAFVFGGEFAICVSILAEEITSSEDVRSFAEIMIDDIKRIDEQSNSNAQFVIRFSGGVDSMSILLSTCSVIDKSRITCITWISSQGEIDQDAIVSRSLVENIGVSHIELEISAVDLFKVPPVNCISPIVSTSSIFAGVLEQEAAVLKQRYGNNVIVLDGHGGDHVFMDPVPLSFIASERREKGFLPAIAAARQVAKLYGMSLWQTIPVMYRSIPLYNNPILSARARSFVAPSTYSLQSAQQVRMMQIRSAIFQCGNITRKAPGLATHFPLITNSLIAKSLQYQCSDLFDECLTRKPFRLSIQQHYGQQFELRADKGHLTGIYQRAVKEKYPELLEKLQDGVLNSSGLLNLPRAKKELMRCAMGFGGIPIHLLRVLSFELNIWNFKRSTTASI